MTEEDDIDGLAAEYVLGSLDPAERRQVDARRSTDASLDEAIEAWQRRIGPLSELGPEVAPPAHLYKRILARVSERGALPSHPVQSLSAHRASGRGRSLVIGACALAACLGLAVGWFTYMHRDKPPTRLAAMDCGGLYKDFWRKLDPDKYAKLPAEQLAGVSRMALRAYDACQAGDEPDADALFDRLGRMRF